MSAADDPFEQFASDQVADHEEGTPYPEGTRASRFLRGERTDLEPGRRATYPFAPGRVRFVRLVER